VRRGGTGSGGGQGRAATVKIVEKRLRKLNAPREPEINRYLRHGKGILRGEIPRKIFRIMVLNIYFFKLISIIIKPEPILIEVRGESFCDGSPTNSACSGGGR
jgi:hypothetical protein